MDLGLRPTAVTTRRVSKQLTQRYPREITGGEPATMRLSHERGLRFCRDANL